MADDSPNPVDKSTEDPWPLHGGVCEIHGEFNNFSGTCWGCRNERGGAL